MLRPLPSTRRSYALKTGSKRGKSPFTVGKIGSCGLEECVRKAAKASGWEEKRAQNRFARGIGLACCNHVSGNRAFAREFDGGAGIVRIGREGKVLVYHGESDMGQGQRTIFAQIVAEELGLSLDQIEVARVDTDVSPFGMGSFATRGTVFGGNGVKAAATEAKRQIFEIAAEMLEANPSDLEAREGKVYVKGSPGKTSPSKKWPRPAFTSGGARRSWARGSGFPIR